MHASTILLISGILTSAALLGAFAPRPALTAFLGVDAPDATVVLMGRHWFFLIGLVGLLLVYASAHPAVQFAALVVGAAEKVLFVAIVAATALRRRPAAALAATADGIMSLLFLALLLGRG